MNLDPINPFYVVQKQDEIIKAQREEIKKLKENADGTSNMGNPNIQSDAS